jgi:hypothetical protein
MAARRASSEIIDAWQQYEELHQRRDVPVLGANPVRGWKQR